MTREWTLVERGRGQQLIKCDDYEIGEVFARQDLLDFIVTACNQREHLLAGKREERENDLLYQRRAEQRIRELVDMSKARLSTVNARWVVDKSSETAGTLAEGTYPLHPIEEAFAEVERRDSHGESWSVAPLTSTSDCP